MVRIAKFTDIPRIVELMEESHQRSIYAERGTFDPKEAKQFLASCIQRHGQKNYGATCALVSEVEGKPEGFLLGFLDQVYPCLKELMATDLLFIFSERANPKDAYLMVRWLIRWAKDNPKVIEITMGITDAINSDWHRTAMMYEKIGFRSCGAIYQMGVNDVQSS